MAVDKLVDSTQLDSDLTSVANAIRTKGGTSGSMSFPSGFVSAIQNIPSGGGGGTVTKSDVNFYDYDGTLVASKTKTEINAMTSDSDLPENPSHTGLTAQGWNWTVAQLKAQLTAMPDQPVNVGQMYVTTSGKTEIDVVMPEGRLEPILTIAVNGEISVDWGDNTTPDTVTGTSEETSLAVGPHTYSASGSYTITITPVSGKFAFYGGGSANTLLRKGTIDYENRVYANCVKAIRLGNGTTSIGNSAFYYCYSLSSVTIPSSVTDIVSSAFAFCYSLSSVTIPSSVTSIESSEFYYCYALSSITIPSSVTSIGGNTFTYCYTLSSVTIPSTVTSIGSSMFQNCNLLSSMTIPSTVTNTGTSMFQNCYALSSITIPSTVTNIKASTFQNCYSLSSVTIPSTVTSIGNNAFNSCYGMKKYHFLSTTPPTLGTTVFKNIISDCIIYVPRSENQTVLNDYKTASNWSSYASYMQEEPAT